MNARQKLFHIADHQQGFFTAKQAKACGIAPSHFHRRVQSGDWIKEMRGVYRLAQYPLADRPELVLWTLWSRDKEDRLQGTWSHETALDIHELSDVMPAKMHMTVPISFRKRVAIPGHLHLHYANLAKKDMEIRSGYRVTTPLRTLTDVIDEGTLSEELISQAIREGVQRGLLLPHELSQISKFRKYEHAYRV